MKIRDCRHDVWTDDSLLVWLKKALVTWHNVWSGRPPYYSFLPQWRTTPPYNTSDCGIMLATIQYKARKTSSCLAVGNTLVGETETFLLAWLLTNEWYPASSPKKCIAIWLPSFDHHVLLTSPLFGLSIMYGDPSSIGVASWSSWSHYVATSKTCILGKSHLRELNCYI